jgi:hypothetical protein
VEELLILLREEVSMKVERENLNNFSKTKLKAKIF